MSYYVKAYKGKNKISIPIEEKQRQIKASDTYVNTHANWQHDISKFFFKTVNLKNFTESERYTPQPDKFLILDVWQSPVYKDWGENAILGYYPSSYLQPTTQADYVNAIAQQIAQDPTVAPASEEIKKTLRIGNKICIKTITYTLKLSVDPENYYDLEANDDIYQIFPTSFTLPSTGDNVIKFIGDFVANDADNLAHNFSASSRIGSGPNESGGATMTLQGTGQINTAIPSDAEVLDSHGGIRNGDISQKLNPNFRLNFKIMAVRFDEKYDLKQMTPIQLKTFLVDWYQSVYITLGHHYIPGGSGVAAQSIDRQSNQLTILNPTNSYAGEFEIIYKRNVSLNADNPEIFITIPFNINKDVEYKITSFTDSGGNTHQAYFATNNIMNTAIFICYPFDFGVDTDYNTLRFLEADNNMKIHVDMNAVMKYYDI